MRKNDRFLRACRREPVDATPIWLMRQAGRYMAEYRAVREKHSLLEMIKSPELALQVSLQPIRAFDVDAVIVFADILTLLEGLGLPLRFEDGRGPVLEKTIQSPADIDRLSIRPPQETLAFTLDAIRLVKQNLNGTLPLIGFSGAPFTLACYAIEGGSSRAFAKVKSLMYGDPKAWHRLMEKLAEAVGAYLRAQAAVGADALQLFDSWVGCLSPADYREYVQPHTRRALSVATSQQEVPVIHFGTGTAGLLDLMKDAGGAVIGVDWRTDLAEAWERLGPDVAVQGNLDPLVLCAPAPEIHKQAAWILDRVRGRPGHIFNLGHGILPQTPVAHVKTLVDFVHAHTKRTA